MVFDLKRGTILNLFGRGYERSVWCAKNDIVSGQLGRVVSTPVGGEIGAF